MKKFILTIITIISFIFCANAQSDGFFGGWGEESGDRATGMTVPSAIGMPSSEIGSTNNENVPLNNGLIILCVLGAAYATAKSRKVNQLYIKLPGMLYGLTSLFSEKVNQLYIKLPGMLYGLTSLFSEKS
jgi:hypothetical protein